MAAVEHFEIPADDMARASAFYTAVFGFTYEPWGDDAGMIITGSDDGINGDLHQRAEVPHPTIVVTVDRIEDTVAAVEAHGGSALGGIQMLNERDRWAYVKDSEGNTIGLFDHGDGSTPAPAE
ncbi:putative enzyme related to lactoylglutathione lyase [Clavibacter michiganensis]|uniref:VOC family protein n=1 Tax=Clavibacter michiganensis TaxID=28447 RepID=UPI001AE7F7B8|nr:VOC family protein [Clavibacter michiganensis]MBP2457114.1 putative enzyme related to lactoylglutathione lyase [Clavibacter michiganensis]MDQ0409684.1 putative enzyme related to lactoylglutathione lyase [Clavibacter michiganensis]